MRDKFHITKVAAEIVDEYRGKWVERVYPGGNFSLKTRIVGWEDGHIRVDRLYGYSTWSERLSPSELVREWVMEVGYKCEEGLKEKLKKREKIKRKKIMLKRKKE